MSGVPTSIHLGPFVFHLYGLGLGIAAYVAYLYAERRLRRHGIDTAAFARYTLALLVAGLFGARLANIVTNWGYYSGHPARWIAVWQGGISSFGGIGFAIPVGIIAQRHWWPSTRLLAFTDALIPALVAGWALGRVLGPQFMVNGGGHQTTSWFGIHYSGQIGKRVPVPLIQGAEDAALWLILIRLEAKWTTRAVGVISAVAMIIWGLVRAYDERWLLGQQSHSGSIGVQLAGLALTLAGIGTWWRVSRRPRVVTTK
ncbi:MAG: prolipoprotein diacylglyceryl transferase [Actinomycetota bacterium]|nr:prolipoprotein diacylglyceryl transferase [Actinomycetota bacterium]